MKPVGVVQECWQCLPDDTMEKAGSMWDMVSDRLRWKLLDMRNLSQVPNQGDFNLKIEINFIIGKHARACCRFYE